MTVTDEKNRTDESTAFGVPAQPPPSRDVVKKLTEKGALEGLFAPNDSGQLQLADEIGFVFRR